ncbi:MAG TPA: STAS domain-containing protein [Verrucomicrobiae bacterium]|nr:STAS domain-containing protein [Verrucomicrobiae bacterium]
MQELQFKMYRAEEAEVIEMAGAVDALAFSHFASTLTRTMEEVTPRIILDCSRVTYIGSAQLKELIGYAHMAQARGGDLKCVGLPQTIQQVANLIAMGDLIEFYDHLAEALQAFRAIPETVIR